MTRYWRENAERTVITGMLRSSLSLLLLLCCSQLGAKVADDPRYNRDIRPLLAENCFACHGPDAKQRQADLRLDNRESAIAGGALDPADWSASELLARIESDDPDLVMPPPDTQKQLSAADQQTLRRWVVAGAAYEQHWAYVAPTRPDIPQIAGQAPIHPIDAFIYRALEQQGLAFAAPADAETLLRRVCLDLTGLPPTPEQLATWRMDHSPAAYGKLVDQLLASPHFGERMAPAWLDVVRYADTVGYHGDQNQNVFPYRDWVIDAFNRNLPFDQFTLKQVAGDLLPNPTAEDLTASCFNRLNMVTREGGAQPKEYLAKYSADRVRTVSGAWLGSTLGCAECHDHKYDPFSTRDFYRMAAFFADLKQWGVYQDYGYTPNPDLRGWSNDHPFPPEILVDVPYLQQRSARLAQQRDELALAAAQRLMQSDESKATAAQWLAMLSQFLQQHPSGWSPCKPTAPTAENSKPDEATKSDTSVGFTVAADGQVSLTAEKLDSFIFIIPKTDFPIQSLRLELLPHAAGADSIHPDPNARMNLSLAWERQTADGKKSPLRIHFADAPAKQPTYFNNAEHLGIGNTWRVPGRIAAGISAVWVLDQPLELQSGEQLVITLKGTAARQLRWSASPLVPLDARNALDFGAALDQSVNRETFETGPGPARQLALALSPSDRSALRQLETSIRDCRDGKAWVQVSQPSDKPPTTRVLPRGDWTNETGEVVTPGIPEFLTAATAATDTTPRGPNSDEPQPLTRLELARWLVAPENPLTARVQVNRLWKHFFGEGLSAVLDDFGIQGQYPTHPELLDWLAVEFRESGWDTKHLVKLIVTSAAYQRSSLPSTEAFERDPKNLWLSHQNARRLEAEIVRDNALALSGLLVPDLGGPPVFPYQPTGYYSQLQFPDRDYPEQQDDRRYRRSVYMHWQRTFLHPLLANFDAPPREECTGIRTEANTPLQALTLLNDPGFLEAATGLAVIALGESGDDRQRLERLFERTLLRKPEPAELDSLATFLASQREHFKTAPEDAAKLPRKIPALDPSRYDMAELAAWTSVGRALLNLHETITRY
jgi:hypothetical protein